MSCSEPVLFQPQDRRTCNIASCVRNLNSAGPRSSRGVHSVPCLHAESDGGDESGRRARRRRFSR
eukprot:7829364-Alexandrium_andersonii.AAC.1